MTIENCLRLRKSLFFGADVGAAAGDAEFYDGGAAAWAGLALAPEDASEVHVTSLFALGVYIGVVAAAAFLDG